MQLVEHYESSHTAERVAAVCLVTRSSAESALVRLTGENPVGRLGKKAIFGKFIRRVREYGNVEQFGDGQGAVSTPAKKESCMETVGPSLQPLA